MTNNSLNLSLTLERLIVTSVLTAVITMSVPLRAIAAEVSVPQSPVVKAEVKSRQGGTPIAFTIPAKKKQVAINVEAGQVTETSFNPDTVREKTTGYKVVRVMENVPSTAYTSRPQETDDTPFIAADGTHVYDGMVAANFLKFGTKIRIPELYGDKIFTVHDRMNKRYNVKVDIWMTNLKDAYKHGLRHIKIEILEPIADESTVVATTQS
jgi:3D (Asp-Asp-Asp) domain-containing protein